MLRLKLMKNIKANYLTAITTGVLTFMIMTTFLYSYIIVFKSVSADITLLGHALKFIVMFVIGLAISAVLGLFFIKHNNHKNQNINYLK